MINSHTSVRWLMFILAFFSPFQAGISGEPRLYESNLLPESYVTYLPFVTAPNNSIFGASLTSSFTAGELEMVETARLAWTRIGLDWKTIESTRGSLDWSNASMLEQSLLAFRRAGIQTILILDGTPGWALKSTYTCGAIQDVYFSEFANFASEVVRRYSGYPYFVKYVELYNEPDTSGVLGCWGDPNDTSFYGGAYYGQMLQTVYPAIKNESPNVQVLIGGLLLDCDPVNPPDDPTRLGQKKDCTPARFFDGILSSGASNSFDGISFHSYDYYNGPGQYSNPNWHTSRLVGGSSTLAKAVYLRNTMLNYRIGLKPLFNTEYALFCGSFGVNTCGSFQNDVEATKAYYIVQFMASSLADQYQTAIWFATLADRNTSLVNLDLTPLPVYNAYKFTNQILSNAKYVQRLSIDPAITIYEFQKPGGNLWILWTNDTLYRSLALPSFPKAIYRIGTDGNAVSESPSQNVNLDVAPLIIDFSQ